ncbi:MAG: hypothetical protein JXQ96_23165 [Cyclobacteriaceae bacterium]
MKTNLTLILAALLAFSCRTSPEESSKEVFDPEQEKEAILKMAGDRFGRMLAAKTPKAVAQVYTENTISEPVYMPQNGNILVGREAIIEWGIEFFGEYDLTADWDAGPYYDNWTVKKDLAIHQYVAKGYFIERATGDSVRTDQKTTDIFHKINGEWLYASHSWNANRMDVVMFNPDCVRN